MCSSKEAGTSDNDTKYPSRWKILSNAKRPTRGAGSRVLFSAHTNSTKFGVYTSASSLAERADFSSG
jgi:hypothetical protein